MRTSRVREFQIGDLVIAAKDYPQYNHSIRKGQDGVVCHLDDNGMIGVDWGFDVDGGHSCDGFCQYGYGWFVEAKEIELSGVEQDIDEDSFLQVIGGAR